MAIRQDQVAITIKELMTAIKAAQEAGFPVMHPHSAVFNFPIEGVTGASVQFEVMLDWYKEIDENALWPTAK